MSSDKNRRQSGFHLSEIEALAIEALDQARLLPPGPKRQQLLKEAGLLRSKALAARLATAQPPATSEPPRGARRNN
jgi:hypothetical protein